LVHCYFFIVLHCISFLVVYYIVTMLHCLFSFLIFSLLATGSIKLNLNLNLNLGVRAHPLPHDRRLWTVYTQTPKDVTS